ncbi:hypothetical protein PR003_g31752, partial [Phytophthora rubi]
MLTQDEALELYLVLWAMGMDDSWTELVHCGLITAPERPLIPVVRFNLLSHGNANAVADFRFDVHGVRRLAALYGLPETVITSSNDRCNSLEAISILLYRLSYPRRLHDMSIKFRRSTSSLCRIFLCMVDYVDDRYKDKQFFDTELAERRMAQYCAAISARTHVEGVFAFPDGTKVPICRPKSMRDGINLQRSVYSGHKRVHCLVFQGLTTPDGLCMHFYGPYEGRRHDTTVFAASGLLRHFERHSSVFEGRTIFGDPAYSISKYVVTGYKQAVLSTHQRVFNKEMSAVRTSVEWNFKVMKSLWA